MAKEQENTALGTGLPGIIQVRVSDFEHGLRVFDGVQLVRIKSDNYSLLIMEDYFPLLGNVRGTVELVTDDDLVNLGRIEGFYVSRRNEFSLLIKDQLDESDRGETEEAP